MATPAFVVQIQLCVSGVRQMHAHPLPATASATGGNDVICADSPACRDKVVGSDGGIDVLGITWRLPTGLFSASFALCCCGGECDGQIPASASTCVLRQPSIRAQEALAHLRLEAQVPYDAANPEHEGLLDSYFQTCTGTSPPMSTRDPRWQELGFQSDNPRTDFRAGGLLSLRCMAFLAEERPASTRKMMAESTSFARKRTEARGPAPGYPFSAAVVNICFGLAGWLRLDPHRLPSRLESCPDRSHLHFVELLAIEPDAFKLLVACAVAAMHEDWVKHRRSAMDLGASIKVANQKVALFLAGLSGGSLEKIMAATRQTWML